MCGRFNVSASPLSDLLIDLVGLTYTGLDNPNLAPTETVEVIRMGADGKPELVTMRWWLTPFWAKELSTRYSMFNAKSETAARSPAFREPYRKRRCVVPVSGFYEWCREQGKKMPYLIVPHTEPGMLLAGLWDEWRNPESGEALLSFTILTTAVNPDLGFVHDRQPVMLSREEALNWLDMENPTAALESFFDSHIPVELVVIPVSTHVNNARHKDARCTEPVGPAIAVPPSEMPPSKTDEEHLH